MQQSQYHLAKQRKRDADESLWTCPICKHRFKDWQSHVYYSHLIKKKEFIAQYGNPLDVEKDKCYARVMNKAGETS